MGNHRVTCASAVGRSHENNQDRFGWRELDDGSLLLVVADGAGSAKRGGEAASAVVEALLAWKESEPTMTVFEQMFEEMRIAQSGLRALAAKTEEPSRSFNCTALLVHVSSVGFCHALSIGDSWLTYNDEMESWAFPLPPQKGQYANETRFLISTGQDSWQMSHWQLPLQSSMVLLTDGLDDIAIHQGSPFAPFFRSFNQALMGASDRASWLQSFLNSDRVKSRCSDDRTVLHWTWEG